MDELRGFLSGYLHEDWPVEVDDPMVAARQFASTEDPAFVARAVEQGRLVVVEAGSDDDLARQLAALGCHYVPDTSDTVGEWFGRLLDVIEREPR